MDLKASSDLVFSLHSHYEALISPSELCDSGKSPNLPHLLQPLLLGEDNSFIQELSTEHL